MQVSPDCKGIAIANTWLTTRNSCCDLWQLSQKYPRPHSSWLAFALFPFNLNSFLLVLWPALWSGRQTRCLTWILALPRKFNLTKPLALSTFDAYNKQTNKQKEISAPAAAQTCDIVRSVVCHVGSSRAQCWVPGFNKALLPCWVECSPDEVPCYLSEWEIFGWKLENWSGDHVAIDTAGDVGTSTRCRWG